MAQPSLMDRFLAVFRARPSAPPPLALRELDPLTPADFESRREAFPIYPFTGWDAKAIMQMLDAHDIGNFQLSEQFYHALKKDGLIGSALQMLTETACDFPHSLQCPKHAPDELHQFTDELARNWQAVLPDEILAEIVERVAVFGMQVCRIQWTWRSGQREMRLIPWTHSNLMWRQDLWCYQGLSQDRGIEYISNDGREWVVFSLGGTRPWLKGMIRRLAFAYWQIITGDDLWANFNDKFAQPIKNRIIPRVMRESIEAQRLYSKEDAMRGGDMVVSPQDVDHGRGYDLKYVQVDAQGYQTMQDLLARFDERAAIIILGHNLLQSVKGGSLAAMREAMKLLRRRAFSYLQKVQTGCEDISKTWARANFGSDPADWPELNGATPADCSWSLVFDKTDPDEKMQAGVRAAQFGQAFGTFVKALEKAPPEAAAKFWQTVDILEAMERAGIPLLDGEDTYDENDAAELAADEHYDPPEYMKRAARRSLGWVHEFRRGGTEVGRSMARKIVRGRLSRADVLHIARYWPRHEGDRSHVQWKDLRKPSNGRIAWGLWGDLGDGRGRKWSEDTAAKIKGSLSESEARTIGARLALLDGDPLDMLAAPEPQHSLAPRLGTRGSSQRTRDLTAIASVAVFDGAGRLLMGKRRDSGKWTLPGGHLEPGEAPHAAAIRELWEEATVSASLRHIGSGQAGAYLIHAYRADGVAAAPSVLHDPDQEVDAWEWIALPLPDAVAQNLHAPRNVTLALIGAGKADGLLLLPAEA